MKKIWSLIILMMTIQFSHGQTSNKQLNAVTTLLNGHLKSDIQKAVNGIITSPELYNTLWKDFLDQAQSKTKPKWQLLHDLNIKFKTFQNKDTTITGLGLSYDFTYDYANFSEKKNYRVSKAFTFSTKGNVAFKKELNPSDFLETNVSYSQTAFKGGVVRNPDTAIFNKLNDIEDQLAKLDDISGEEASALWKEFGKSLVLSNQFYYSFSPKFGYESNQDFSKTQFTPGIAIYGGAKAWNNRNSLAKINVFDYPFALIRLLTGIDKSFIPYGSTLPTAGIGFEYVVPDKDKTRELLLGNKTPFPRLKFETSFRTLVSEVDKQIIFFNADFRYYQELNAAQTIKSHNISRQTYFVMALQSTAGFFVSYASGKLPFDAKNDQVYSIGFNYKF